MMAFHPVAQRILKAAGFLALSLILLAAGALAYLAYRNSGTFLQRLADYPLFNEISAVDWYRPKEPVEGSPRPEQIPLQPPPAPLKLAVTQAQAYWEQRKTFALLIWHDGKLIHEWYAPGFGPDSTTNSMSMAKPLLALAVGKAIEKGFIPSTEEPIERWITEWEDQPRGRIRLRHLLQMTSGLDLDENGISPFSDIARLHLSERMTPILLESPLGSSPGTRPKYSNWNSQLLTLILERATRLRYSVWLGREVWRHLGTRAASVWTDEDGLAKGYCCVFARPRDWLQVGKLFLEEGRLDGRPVVSSSWIREMVDPSPLRSNYGYGLWLAAVSPGDVVARRMKEPFAAKDLFYLDGRRHQRVYVVPSRRLIIVRVGDAWPDFTEEYVPNLLIRAVDDSGRTL